VAASGGGVKTTSLHEYAAVPRRARISGSRLLYHSTLGLRVIKKKKKK
jgi:hypothetical protein